jgi:hypothetical protein
MGIARDPGRRLDRHKDDTILSALNELPFPSSQSLSQTLKRPLSTIRDHFARAVFVLTDLKWVRRMISAGPKKTGVELAGAMLHHLSSARSQGRDYFLVGDES